MLLPNVGYQIFHLLNEDKDNRFFLFYDTSPIKFELILNYKVFLF
jgi:hypothetical protein